ncbi:MAG: hypothetical protein WBP38_00510, partial [Hyphomicrobium sp.]
MQIIRNYSRVVSVGNGVCEPVPKPRRRGGQAARAGAAANFPVIGSLNHAEAIFYRIFGRSKLRR